MFAFSRFADVDDAFVAQLQTVAEYWRTSSGNLSVEVLRNIDDPSLAALASSWRDVGSYRRSFMGYEAKMLLTPVMLRALDEPSAYLPHDKLCGDSARESSPLAP